MANDTTSPVAAPIEGPPVTGTGKKPGFRDSAGYGPIITFASVVSLLLLWQVGAALLPPNVFAGPLSVTQALFTQMQTAELWQDMGKTLQRIAFAFLLAMGVSLFLGFVMAMSRTAGLFFRVWVVLGLTVPSLVIILTIYMTVGLNETAAVFGAALPIIPILAINIREGVSSIDLGLRDMAVAFRASRMQIIRDVIAPQIAPVLLASSRFGVGLIWKMVLFVELLGRSDGIGYKIEFYYQLFNMRMVLAYALSFLFVMLLIEIAIFGVLERKAFGWRRGRA